MRPNIGRLLSIVGLWGKRWCTLANFLANGAQSALLIIRSTICDITKSTVFPLVAAGIFWANKAPSEAFWSSSRTKSCGGGGGASFILLGPEPQSHVAVMYKHRTENVTTRHHCPTGRGRIYILRARLVQGRFLWGESRAVFGFLRSKSTYSSNINFTNSLHFQGEEYGVL